MAGPRSKPNGAWATAQLLLAIGTAAWAVLLFVYPGPEGPPTDQFHRDLFIPGFTMLAAVFFFVAFILFSRDHPDASVVAVFGVAIFAISNGYLVYDRYNAASTCVDVLKNNYACNPFRGERLEALIGAAAVITLVQTMLLVTVAIWNARDRRRAEDAKLDAAEEAMRVEQQRRGLA